MKVALVYDRVNKWGGAERVLLALHEIFPDAPLFTSVYNRKNAKWAKVFKVKTSFLQNIPGVSGHNELFPLLMPLAFERFNFDEYDLVISVTSEFAKGIKTSKKTKHISIVLTPTRYLWSGYDSYFRGKTFKFFSKPIVFYLRKKDLEGAGRPDKYIAISEEVRKRIKKYYKKDSKVIYPPINIKSRGYKVKKGNYFVLVSRLSKFVYYKRVDLVIETFNKLGLPLKIVGHGSQEKKLKAMANKNIEFLGRISDEELEKVYRGARALIFPGVEDFGLVMAEAQFFGTPVIAFKAGGAREIVIEGKTGVFFHKQTVGSLYKVLKSFDEREYNRKVILENSKRFTFSKFKKELNKFIREETK